jgi:hypothetical protein
MKNVIIIAGPERTGTRIWAQIIIDGGYSGDSSHEQGSDIIFYDAKHFLRRAFYRLKKFKFPSFKNVKSGVKFVTDQHKLPDQFDNLVVRRSYPHSSQWPDLHKMSKRLKKRGYKNISVIVTSRDWNFHVKSHERAIREEALKLIKNYTSSEQTLQIAYKKIFKQISKAKLDFVIVSYENLIRDSETMFSWLQERFNLPQKPNTEIYDGNVKYQTKK